MMINRDVSYLENNDVLKRPNLRQRAWEAIASVVFSKFVRIGEQLVLVPVYLVAWGIDTYGEWLTVTAATAFVSLTNVGLNQAAASEIVMAIGAGDRERAQRALSNSNAILTLIALIGITVLTVIALDVNLSALGGFIKLAPRDLAVIAWGTGATVILLFSCGPLFAALSATIGAGRANLVPTSTKIGEAILIAVALLRGGSPEIVALIMFLFAIITVAGYFVVTHRFAPWLKLFSLKIDRELLLRLVRPSFGYLTLFLSMNLVGTALPRIMLFSTLGSSAVTVFSVTTTYARTSRVLSGIISPALQVEVGHAYGAGDVFGFVNLVNKMCRLSVWSAITLSGGLFLCSFVVIPLWTDDRVPLDLVLLIFLLADSVVGSLVEPIIIARTIINRVGIIAWVHLVTLLLGLVIGSIFVDRVGPAAIAVGLLVPDVAVIAFGRSGFGRAGGGEEQLLRLRELVRWPGDLLQNELAVMVRLSLIAKLLRR
jgi:O-antigen/teichoic acid export membrane protein